MNPILTTPEYLMLEYAPKFQTKKNQFQQFWKFRYNVNPNQLLSDMLKRNLICVDSISITLNHSDITTLKEALKKLGLKCTGKKADLISRLLENTDYNLLNELFPHRYYALTDFGTLHKDTLEFSNVLFAHRHPNYDVSADEVPLGMNIKDYIWGQLNNRSLYYYNKKQWGLYRNTRHLMGELLSTENKLEKAFPFYIEVCVCDILDSFIAPGIYEHLNKLRKKIDYSEDDLFNNVEISLESLTIPIEIGNTRDVASYITQKIINFTYEPSEQLHLNATEKQ